MLNYTSVIVGLLSVLFIVGCGEGDSNCSQEFISDYNEIALGSMGVWTKAEASSLRSKAVEFKNKYAGVSCVAEVKKTNGLGNEKITIDANSKMDSIIRAVDSALTAK